MRKRGGERESQDFPSFFLGGGIPEKKRKRICGTEEGGGALYQDHDSCVMQTRDKTGMKYGKKKQCLPFCIVTYALNIFPNAQFSRTHG